MSADAEYDVDEVFCNEKERGGMANYITTQQFSPEPHAQLITWRLNRMSSVSQLDHHCVNTGSLGLGGNLINFVEHECPQSEHYTGFTTTPQQIGSLEIQVYASIIAGRSPLIFVGCVGVPVHTLVVLVAMNYCLPTDKWAKWPLVLSLKFSSALCYLSF